MNPSDDETVHLLQIWLVPETKGLPPGYEDRAFDPAEKHGRLRALVSPNGVDGSLTVQQDAVLYDAALEAGQAVEHSLANGRYAWVQVTEGGLELNGVGMSAGDGASVSGEDALRLVASDACGVLVFDLG